jgi:periplasmic divalent cation tolerance protein
MTDNIVILSTCSSEEEGERLARRLVDARLAACVNIIPRVRSVYRWKGQVEDAAECLLLIKSSKSLFDAVRSSLEAAHSYEVPEVVALPVLDVSPKYLKWLQENLQSE